MKDGECMRDEPFIMTELFNKPLRDDRERKLAGKQKYSFD